MSMVYASRHPGTLAGLVLIGASAVAKGPGVVVYRGFARMLPVVGYDRMARFTNWVARRLGGDAAGELPGGESYAATAAAWEAVMTDCGPEQLREVDCPVFLVNGQFDQMRAHVRQFASECRSVRVVTVPRVTHLMPLTHPELVAEVLAEAVEQVQPETRAG
jgi:pimeloyl-ACP methyl ester carboxylesterase